MPSPFTNSTAQSIIDNFETQAGGATTPEAEAVYGAITSSPVLLDWFNNAALNGELVAINYLSSTESIGHYDTQAKAFEFSAGYIDQILSGRSGPTDPAALDDLVFGIGHESGHADDYVNSVKAADDAWQSQIPTFVAGLSASDDATTLVQSYLTTHIRDEAGANIQGWNDEVSLATALGQSISTIKSTYFFDASGNPLPGITVDATTSQIAPTTDNISAEAQVEAAVHPSISGRDAGVTYDQFYAASALNYIEASVSGHPISADFHSLGIDQPGVDDPPFIWLDQALIDQRLVEAGFHPSGTNLDIVNTYDMSTSRFSSSAGGYVVNVFASGDPYADTHEVLTATGAAAEVDRYNGSDGTQYERDITSFNADGTVQTISHAYFVVGDNSESLLVENAAGNEQWAAYWDSAGTLGEYDDLSSGHLVSRYFLSDGGQSVDVFNNDMTVIIETAAFGSGATFASEITKTDPSGVTTDELFDASGLLASVTRYDQTSTTLEQDTFVSGHLSREELINPQAGISDETWTFDSASGQMTGFSEAGSQAQSWAKQSDGRWLDLIHNTYSSMQPSSIPSAPATPEVFDATDLILPTNWAPPTPIHTVDPFHF